MEQAEANVSALLALVGRTGAVPKQKDPTPLGGEGATAAAVSIVTKGFCSPDRCVGPTMWIFELSMSQWSGNTLPWYISLPERSCAIW